MHLLPDGIGNTIIRAVQSHLRSYLTVPHCDSQGCYRTID